MFKKILCPIEIVENNQRLVDLAASLAKQNDAELILLHVANPPLAQESMFAGEEVEAAIAADQMEFEKISPKTDLTCQHIFLRGNPGPQVVEFAESMDCDLIVLGTHGRSGIFRLLMGSVAEYITRHAHCPVLTLRGNTTDAKTMQKKTDKSKPVAQDSDTSEMFVTQFMLHAPAVYAHDEMPDVIGEFGKQKVTAAPVVDGIGECIGILTTTDVERYCDIKRRYQEKDPSVVSEMFEVDEFGQLRTNNSTFEQVQRHMTAPVITISNTCNVKLALEKFKNNPDIHHLIVVDDKNRPLGFVEPGFLATATENNTQNA